MSSPFRGGDYYFFKTLWFVYGVAFFEKMIGDPIVNYGMRSFGFSEGFVDLFGIFRLENYMIKFLVTTEDASVESAAFPQGVSRI